MNRSRRMHRWALRAGTQREWHSRSPSVALRRLAPRITLVQLQACRRGRSLGRTRRSLRGCSLPCSAGGDCWADYAKARGWRDVAPLVHPRPGVSAPSALDSWASRWCGVRRPRDPGRADLVVAGSSISLAPDRVAPRVLLALAAPLIHRRRRDRPGVRVRFGFLDRPSATPMSARVSSEAWVGEGSQ